MSAFDELRAELTHWTHKPGYQFDIEPEFGTAQPMLALTITMADSRSPGHQIRVAFAIALPPHVTRHIDPTLFGAAMLRLLDEAERHETREWLRRDGVLWDDPHAEPSRTELDTATDLREERKSGRRWGRRSSFSRSF
jgi:hypothetical protein